MAALEVAGADTLQPLRRGDQHRRRDQPTRSITIVKPDRPDEGQVFTAKYPFFREALSRVLW
jgi:hypothetical protein